jgi:RNA polymerase sigma-70 factor (ECF subfamily)
LGKLEDAALALSAGDFSAFETIVTSTQARLVRLGARMMGDLADGEDVVQEAYLKAYRALAGGRFDAKSSVETWLYRIVANTALDALRTRKRRGPMKEMAKEPAWNGAEAAEGRLALRELHDMLGELPPDQRAAIVLHALEGKTAREIAELLSTTEGAVEQLLVRGRAALRKHREVLDA